MWAPDSGAVELPLLERISDPEELLAQVVECLQAKDAHGLKTYILEHKFKDQSVFWELILKIGNCVHAVNSENNPAFFDVCNRCLVYLVKVGNPKETLLAILEQMDSFIDDIAFKSFLPLIQMSLLKIPSKLFHSLDIALETVSAHLTRLPPPENVQLEGDEVKVFHMDKTVVRLVDILQAYLDFLEPFVKGIDLTRDRSSEPLMQQAAVLKRHLAHVFDHPLYYLVLTHDQESSRVKSDSRLCVEQAMSLFAHLETDFYRFLRNVGLDSFENSCRDGLKDLLSKDTDSFVEEEHDNEENERRAKSLENNTSKSTKDIVENWDFKLSVTHTAQACIAYLIHSEHLGIDKFPAVFSHQHLLEFHLSYLTLLLENTTYPVNMKGLLLTDSLVKLISKSSIVSDSLDNPGYLSVINDLIIVMIKCPVKDHRVLATKLFPLLISKFDAAGRYKIYVSILSSCSHSGIKGFLITLMKNDIAEHLRFLKQRESSSIDEPIDAVGDSAREMQQFYEGKRLRKLLLLALSLPESETSDMLENSDQIISGLNLLRFLVLADPASANLTKFWDYMSVIEKQFIEPLRRGLDLSRAHYKLEQDNVSQGRAKPEGAKEGPEVSVSVGGMNVPAMEKKEKLQLIGKALNTHDIMLGLLARVSELMDQSK
ncbi:glomulin isoform X1 [Aplysia californica]|uniref:Glomulin isoform X1 n=1 Tax=Aplysia californica TaxID=6500 RepID=A0ABM1VTF9_APLCA|nr:glomulin isoform X1 [Aplysia californica]